MPKLMIWTSSEAHAVERVFASVLRSFRPDVPQHEFVVHQVGDVPPKVLEGDILLCCGDKPLESLRVAGIVPKNRTVNSMREKPINAPGGGTIMVTYDPRIVNMEPEKQEIIEWDVRLAVRVLRTRSLMPEIGEYKYVNDYGPMIEWIKAEYARRGNKAVDVSCDTETMGFYAWYPDKDIVSISFTAKPQTAEVLYLGPQKHPITLDPDTDLFGQIQWLLTTPMVKTRFANGKYDLIWIGEKWGIECTNFKFDTMLVGTLLNENRCVSPETKLLTADLRWVEAGSVNEGDELVAFDENPPAQEGKGFPHRRMRKAKALSVELIHKPRLRLNLSNGSSVVVSDNHQFLCRKYPSTHVKVWRRANRIKEGCVICHATPAPHAIRGLASDFDLGRLSGFLDGEGSVPKVNEHGSWSLSWGQKPHAAHQDMKRVASEIGFEWREHDDSINVCKTVVAKGSYSALHALIATRPLRLISKEPWVNGPLPRPQDDVTVISVEDLGVGPVVALETDTHTFIAEGLLSHNSNSLNTHAKTLTPMGGYDDPFNAKYDKGKMETIPAGEDLLVYAGGDTDACQRVADVLRDELTDDPALTRFYITILHPAARAFEKIERRGVHIDVDKFHTLRDDLQKLIKEGEKSTLDLLPNKMKIKYRDRIDDQIAKGKNPMLPSILKEFFFSPSGLNLKPKETTAKTGEPSMAKSHLRQFAHVPEAMAMVEALTTVDTASKTLSTFVEGFLKHLRPDGMLHPQYFLGKAEFEGHDDDDSGTVTGRLSAKDPPFQIIPKKTKWAKRVRECFTAPPGKVLISIDYSQGELKVVACFAPEPTMLKAYEDGLDLHAVTGAKLAQVDLKEFLTWKDNEDAELAALFEKNRGNAKPANFGLLYGQQVEGFMAYAWANYGIRLTYEEAEKMRNAFFELYPGLLKYHDRQRMMVGTSGMVRSPLGRIRHLPQIKSTDRMIRSKANRQAINSPIQSTLTDMMIFAIALIDKHYPNGEIGVVGMIHDALIGYVPENDVNLWAGRAAEIMSNLPLHEVGWKPQLPFTVDIEAGPNLAAVKKLKLSA